MRDKVQSRKFLEDADRIGSTENGDCAREADVFCARGSRRKNHHWGRIKELSSVMFADAKNIQTDVVRELNLFQ